MNEFQESLLDALSQVNENLTALAGAQRSATEHLDFALEAVARALGDVAESIDRQPYYNDTDLVHAVNSCNESLENVGEAITEARESRKRRTAVE